MFYEAVTNIDGIYFGRRIKRPARITRVTRFKLDAWTKTTLKSGDLKKLFCVKTTHTFDVLYVPHVLWNKFKTRLKDDFKLN